MLSFRFAPPNVVIPSVELLISMISCILAVLGPWLSAYVFIALFEEPASTFP